MAPMTSMPPVRQAVIVLMLSASVGCDRQVTEGGQPSLPRLGAVTKTDTLIPPSGEAYDLFDATHLSSFSDGSIALLNRGTQEVLVFTSLGQLVARFGGPGQGPGEFTQPTFLTVIPGDSVLVMDLVSQRMVVFTREGLPARTFTLETPPVGEFYVFPIGVTAERLVVTSQGVAPVQPNSTPGMEFVPARVLAYNLEGGIVRVVEQPEIGGEFFLFEQEGMLRSVAPPFRRRWVMAAGAAGVALASSVSRHVLPFDASVRSQATIPFPGDVQPLPRSVVDSALSAWVESAASPEAQILRRRLLADMPRPEAPPVIADLRFDRLDRLWVAASQANGSRDPRWYIIDGRSAIGFIELPPDLRVMEIGRDYVLGIATDALDVQSVVKLHLSWNEQPRAA